MFLKFLRFLTGLALCCVRCAMGKETILFSEDFRTPIGGRWKEIKFHDPTDYQVIWEQSNACLKAFASGGCSAFATKVALPPGTNLLCSWDWKIDRCPTNGCDNKISGFDHAARVFIAFDTWIGVPRTINYVWANHAGTNTTFEHPFSGRTKFMVVESGNTNAGRWLSEHRDIREDWNRLFNCEPMPKIVAIGVFTDSHYTRTPVTGWYRNILVRQSDAIHSIAKLNN